MDYADTLTAERTKKVITGYNYKGKKKQIFFRETHYGKFAKV